ncbi:MAG TPA: hypothetical protein VHD36_05155 [Pirellulales bacterium]|nr:hypothetical protein [Pirellulales bacterium]
MPEVTQLKGSTKMKMNNVSALIAAVTLVAATSVGASASHAQVHHNMHTANQAFAGGMPQGMNGVPMNYAHMTGGNGFQHAYRYGSPPFSGAAGGQAVAPNNNAQFLPVTPHHNFTQGTGHGLVNSGALIPSTPVVGSNASALATVRQEVRTDKMAVRNDMATGNNGRLAQDEARLQADRRLERQLEGQGAGAWNTGAGVRSSAIGGFNQNRLPFVQTSGASGANVLTARDLRRQNYAALHANYKNRNTPTDLVKVHSQNTDRVETGGMQRAHTNAH